MAELLVRLRHILMGYFIFSLLQDQVLAYYCEWNLCRSEQYCCGDNQCCSNAHNAWYFWMGTVVLVLMLLSCGGFFRYCYPYRPQIIVHHVTNYVPLLTEAPRSEELWLQSSNRDPETPPTALMDCKDKSQTMLGIGQWGGSIPMKGGP